VEEFMADIGHGLMIKYGLAHQPSSERAQEWARLTRLLMDRGVGREDAGARAAQQLFTDYRTRYYASEADTIEMLLRQASEK
jgi:hypothetical protein